MGESTMEPYSEYGDEATGPHNEKARHFLKSLIIRGDSG